jgi:hypothetical protein
VHYFTIIVLLILDFFESEDTIEETRGSHTVFPSNAAQTFVSYIQNHTDYLLCQIKRASTVDNVLTLKLEGGWIFIQL